MAKMARELQKRASGFSGGRGAGGGTPPKGALLGGGGVAMLIAGGLLVQSSLFNGACPTFPSELLHRRGGRGLTDIPPLPVLQSMEVTEPSSTPGQSFSVALKTVPD